MRVGNNQMTPSDQEKWNALYPDLMNYNAVSWIYSNQRCTITQKATTSQMYTGNYKLILKPGYNFVVLHPVIANGKNSIQELMPNCSILGSWRFNPSGQNWASNSAVNLGETVLVKVASNCEVNGSLSPPTLP